MMKKPSKNSKNLMKKEIKYPKYGKLHFFRYEIFLGVNGLLPDPFVRVTLVMVKKVKL